MASVPEAVNAPGFISAANWGRAVDAEFARRMTAQEARNTVTINHRALGCLDQHDDWSDQHAESAERLLSDALAAVRRFRAAKQYGGNHGHGNR